MSAAVTFVSELFRSFVRCRSKVMKDVVKVCLRAVVQCAECCLLEQDQWDAEFIDRIGENRQMLYDLILVSCAACARNDLVCWPLLFPHRLPTTWTSSHCCTLDAPKLLRSSRVRLEKLAAIEFE